MLENDRLIPTSFLLINIKNVQSCHFSYQKCVILPKMDINVGFGR